MTTTLMTMPVAEARSFAAVASCSAVTAPPAPPAGARLRAVVPAPAAPAVLAPVAVASSAVPSATRVSVVAEVPAIDGNWSRGRGDFGMANYGTTINAQAAKHGKAVGPPRGTSV